LDEEDESEELDEEELSEEELLDESEEELDEELEEDEVSTEGAAPPWVRPACGPQTGQALGPCEARTFSATAICWSLVAWSAVEAYWVPPKAAQVDAENWRPP
jgi:hypothetical protein